MEMPTLHGELVTLRAIEGDADLDALLEIVKAPEVARWWTEVHDDAAEREELRNDGAAWVVEVGGAPVGWLAVSEEDDPGYRHAGLDIVLAPAVHDRGVGTEALRLAIAWLIGERGHHRLTIDPAAANARAIHVYEKVGFRRVGVMRAYERGPDGRWRDGLLMDLLADELARIAPARSG